LVARPQGEHMNFSDLNIIQPILKAIQFEGYVTPTPIQEKALPVLFEGHDILASAQTGTGKTLAFAVPIIQAIYLHKHQDPIRKLQALVLAPTRELAEQIKDSFRNYSKDLGIRTEVIYGGVSQKPQEAAIYRGMDVMVATPGRLLDLMQQGFIKLFDIKYFVLDEADRMLDMGFINDVKKIVSFIPKERQTMLFSATIPNEIMSLANSMLKSPVRIEVTPPETMIEKITQSLYHVAKKDKTNLLIDLLVNPKMTSVLVFTRTKHGANKLVKELLSYGVKADAIHGNKSQNNRMRALADLKSRKLRVLVATDIAARGIDVDELSHVVNYELPEVPETYVHRIGRTGRAGFSGEAISFCMNEELHLLKQIEKNIQTTIPKIKHPLYGIRDIIEVGPKKKTSQPPKNQKKESVKTNVVKEKKSYQELKEEKEAQGSGFKRSELPKKKTEVVVEKQEDPKPAFKPSYPQSKSPFQNKFNKNDGGKKPSYQGSNKPAQSTYRQKKV
jgi:ATP-dependent RNA helicase RhlE